jgi:hypothetical protein
MFAKMIHPKLEISYPPYRNRVCSSMYVYSIPWRSDLVRGGLGRCRHGLTPLTSKVEMQKHCKRSSRP